MVDKTGASSSINLPKKSEPPLRVISKGWWFLLAACILIVIGSLFWAFNHVVETTLTERAVISTLDDVFQIKHISEGTVTDVSISVGSYVKRGQVIGHISVADEENWDALSDDDRERVMRQRRIVSNVEGKVTSVGVSPGAHITTETTVATVALLNEEGSCYYAYALVPLSDASQISIGDTARVYPSGIDVDKYGYLYGTVTSVGATPVADDTVIQRMSPSENEIDTLQNDKTDYVEVFIYLFDDKNGTFMWSSGLKPVTLIGFGTVCEAKICISSEKIISWWVG